MTICKASRISLLLAFVFGSCATPTLVGVTQKRVFNEQRAVGVRYTANEMAAKPEDIVAYKITDLDVLNYTHALELDYEKRFRRCRGLRLASGSGVVGLGALAGGAAGFGWGAHTASALTIGAASLFGLGHVFDEKGQAEAFETALVAVKRMEADYYFYALKRRFVTVKTVKKHVETTDKKAAAPGTETASTTTGAGAAPAKSGSNAAVSKEDVTYTVSNTYYRPSDDIPSHTVLTKDGETLYYRLTKIEKVLDDALQRRIPNLDDLKEANGEGGKDEKK